ncbi:hypothetical protein NDU88_006496 [Pleurodeles waltl]|uniref:Uncharacterized protein n=1 Tax=Pleurodeles waltl TaxID=8319 RepID=A0AAV7RS71_PLEWA|nr:hypothetical protein NDU88_006496 [Pleurodeles waltl]
MESALEAVECWRPGRGGGHSGLSGQRRCVECQHRTFGPGEHRPGHVRTGYPRRTGVGLPYCALPMHTEWRRNVRPDWCPKLWLEWEMWLGASAERQDPNQTCWPSGIGEMWPLTSRPLRMTWETWDKRVDSLERAGDQKEEELSTPNSELLDLRDKNEDLLLQLEDLENCSHRSYIRIRGAPLQADAGELEEYVI